MQDDVKRTAISISIFGETAVGKTCICSTFLGLEFRGEHLTTVGIEKMSSSIKTEDGVELKLKLWDTAGQERFKSVSVKNLRYSQAAIVVFDLTEKESFEKVTDWLKEIREFSDKMPVGLFGNKSDLVDKRVVTQEEINDLCKEENLVYFETSAKNNTGIKEGFSKVATMAFKIFGKVENKGQKLNTKKKKQKSKC
jgi:Ras-related protein Rab-6A